MGSKHGGDRGRMTREDMTAKIDEIQQQLNQLSQQLMQANPHAQNLIGQLQAFNQLNDVLDDKKE
jgi:flagellar biosynthesis/type III secretory pathway chaperone